MAGGSGRIQTELCLTPHALCSTPSRWEHSPRRHAHSLRLVTRLWEGAFAPPSARHRVRAVTTFASFRINITQHLRSVTSLPLLRTGWVRHQIFGRLICVFLARENVSPEDTRPVPFLYCLGSF